MDGARVLRSPPPCQSSLYPAAAITSPNSKGVAVEMKAQQAGDDDPRSSLRSLFEVSEQDFRKSYIRRGKIITQYIAGLAAVVIPFVLAWALVDGVIDAIGALSVVPAYLIILVVVYLKTRESACINRFGVFEHGIAPPRKPRAYRRQKGRVIVPYEAIREIRYKVVGKGSFPNSHYGAVLFMNDGEEFEFDASEIFAQTRWKEEEVARAQVLLEELARQLNLWRSRDSGETFRFEPGKAD